MSYGQCDIVTFITLSHAGGVRVGNSRSSNGKVGNATIVQKTTAGTLAAEDLISGIVQVTNVAAPLTLNIPDVEVILAAFAAADIVLRNGDVFETLFVRDSVGVSNMVLAIAAPALGNHSCTWAVGSAPAAVIPGAGVNTLRLLFQVTSSLTVPSIRIHYIAG
jgi:hypothetical protein